jgi:hypothetical protein
MILCRETVEMSVPARHREPARSGEAGGPPGNRRDSNPRRTCQYVAGFETRGRPGGLSYPRPQQPNHEMSGPHGQED